jgi:hypothetical protein
MEMKSSVMQIYCSINVDKSSIGFVSMRSLENPYTLTGAANAQIKLDKDRSPSKRRNISKSEAAINLSPKIQIIQFGDLFGMLREKN